MFYLKCSDVSGETGVPETSGEMCSVKYLFGETRSVKYLFRKISQIYHKIEEEGVYFSESGRFLTSSLIFRLHLGNFPLRYFAQYFSPDASECLVCLGVLLSS